MIKNNKVLIMITGSVITAILGGVAIDNGLSATGGIMIVAGIVCFICSPLITLFE